MKIQETSIGFKGALAKRTKTNRIIIHHSDSISGNASVIHGWHLNRGWSGIGYHFVILPEGTIQGGRPEWSIGAHSGPAGNGDSIGVCLIGKFEEHAPSEAQMKSLVWLITEHLFASYGKLKVIGHKDVMPTACPGKYFPWTELKKRLEGELVEDWKQKIMQDAHNAGLIDLKMGHKPDDKVEKWFVLAVFLNFIKKGGK